ncbi:MAG: hypothetical protein E7538_10435 [Ruminococcaceae bacterium]|nr:hypothetical protein [Oscillospiraceae bacterium]
MKANKKELSAFKKLFILFTVVVFIICGVVLFWYIAIKQPYNRYMERIVATETGYDYRVREPRFLSTRGEIDIKKSDGDFKIYLEISHAFLKKKYELTIVEGSKDSVTIPVDENLNYITEDYGNIEMRKEKEKILSEYMDEAEEIMHTADIILGLD